MKGIQIGMISYTEKTSLLQICNRPTTDLSVTDQYLKLPLVCNIICYISVTYLSQISHQYVIILAFTDAVQCIDSSVHSYNRLD